jgi:hypothetical protein
MEWSGRAPAPTSVRSWDGGTKDKEHAMSQILNAAIAVVGIDIGKNSFHIVGHDECGAIVLRQKWSRGQVEARFANMPPLSLPKTPSAGVAAVPESEHDPL